MRPVYPARRSEPPGAPLSGELRCLTRPITPVYSAHAVHIGGLLVWSGSHGAHWDSLGNHDARIAGDPTPWHLSCQGRERVHACECDALPALWWPAGQHREGRPVLLLDHVGRKSGRARTAPVLYMRDGEDLVVVALRGGSDAMPAWWLNLQANPATTVQIGTERRRVAVREANAEEKAELWPRLVEMYGDYEIYQRRTEREIPIVILSPAP